MKRGNESKLALMAAMKELMKLDDDEMIHYNQLSYQGNGMVAVRCSCNGKKSIIMIKTDGGKAEIWDMITA